MSNQCRNLFNDRFLLFSKLYARLSDRSLIPTGFEWCLHTQTNTFRYLYGNFGMNNSSLIELGLGVHNLIHAHRTNHNNCICCIHLLLTIDSIFISSEIGFDYCYCCCWCCCTWCWYAALNSLIRIQFQFAYLIECWALDALNSKIAPYAVCVCVCVYVCVSTPALLHSLLAYLSHTKNSINFRKLCFVNCVYYNNAKLL